MRQQMTTKPAGLGFHADVGTPQAENLGHLACHSGPSSDMVAQGRSQAACKTERGRALDGVIRTTPQERWSRGCRGSFWRLQLQQLWQHAPRKKQKSLWSSRLRSSLSTPANTSNTAGRAGRRLPTAPASNPCLPRIVAVSRPDVSLTFAAFPHWPRPAAIAIARPSSVMRSDVRC